MITHFNSHLAHYWFCQRALISDPIDAISICIAFMLFTRLVISGLGISWFLVSSFFWIFQFFYIFVMDPGVVFNDNKHLVISMISPVLPLRLEIEELVTWTRLPILKEHWIRPSIDMVGKNIFEIMTYCVLRKFCTKIHQVLKEFFKKTTADW